MVSRFSVETIDGPFSGPRRRSLLSRRYEATKHNHRLMLSPFTNGLPAPKYSVGLKRAPSSVDEGTVAGENRGIRANCQMLDTHMRDLSDCIALESDPSRFAFVVACDTFCAHHHIVESPSKCSSKARPSSVVSWDVNWRTELFQSFPAPSIAPRRVNMAPVNCGRAGGGGGATAALPLHTIAATVASATATVAGHLLVDFPFR
jgi:hypothetical protein